MANAVGFEGASVVFKAPEGMANCIDLEALKIDGQIVSCWRLTPEELTKIQETGVIWLSIHGEGMPPVSISGMDYVLWAGKPAKAQPYIEPAKRKEP